VTDAHHTPGKPVYGLSRCLALAALVAQAIQREAP
jgi:hypothetical protein